MSVLALDLATATGWARHRNGRTEFGTRKFEAPTLAGFFGEFDIWIGGTLTAHRVGHVAIEAIVPVMGQTNLDTSRKLIGANALVLLNCLRRGIPVMEIGVGQWRSHFLGVIRAPKATPKNKRSIWIKKRCVEECRRRGHDVSDHNAADALGILDYARSKLNPSHGVASTPLFEEVA